MTEFRGMVLVAGGSDNSSVEIFTPPSDETDEGQWSMLRAMPEEMEVKTLICSPPGLPKESILAVGEISVVKGLSTLMAYLLTHWCILGDGCMHVFRYHKPEKVSFSQREMIDFLFEFFLELPYNGSARKNVHLSFAKKYIY